jgi:hypothetical protein
MSSTEMDAERNLDSAARRAAELRSSEETDPAKIERNIDETRADVRATLAALEQRLSVDRLVELTFGRIRDRGGEFASNLGDAATRHPIPVVLTAIGLGWLMLTSGRNGRSGANARPTTPLRDRAAGVKDRVMSAGDGVREQLHGAAESSREAFDHAAESIRGTASRAAEITRSQVDSARDGVELAHERMQRLLDEQPLMLGALGLVAGALIGALLPSTEAENRLVGDVRDKTVRKVARTSRTKYEAARENAQAYSAPAHEDGADGRPSRTH